jgi:hypothetical protein
MTSTITSDFSKQPLVGSFSNFETKSNFTNISNKDDRKYEKGNISAWILLKFKINRSKLKYRGDFFGGIYGITQRKS